MIPVLVVDGVIVHPGNGGTGSTAVAEISIYGSVKSSPPPGRNVAGSKSGNAPCASIRVISYT